MRTRAVRHGRKWGKAVVIGGGYAGLVTARVLADHFSEVVVLEQDPLDEHRGTHPHVPQGYHAHAMLAKGAEVLEKFFPGLRTEMQEIGAPVFDYGEHISFLLPAGFAPRHRTGVKIQTFTRDELERRLRDKVLALPEVTFLPSTRCDGLKMSGPGKVNRVLYRTEGAEQLTELEADLVVNTSGRASALDNWLSEMGLSVPEKRLVKAKITYTSVNIARSEKSRPEFNIAYQMTFAPHVPRGGVVLAVERNRWMCSLFGFEEHVPPTENGAYLDFAKSLKNPRLAEQIEGRTGQEPTHRYTNVNNQWRLYHKMKEWPDRLIALGDAVCVFNPVYGQGLTVAAMEADLLHRKLTEHRTLGAGLDGMSRGFQRAVARIVLTPWTLSSNSDLMWNPDHQPVTARFAHWYNKHLFAVSVRDARVWSRFVRVANMVAPPTVLFHPTVVAKVMSQALSRRNRSAPSNGTGDRRVEDPHPPQDRDLQR
ncbi:FAD-dependent oxidoreductase [Streptomyces sp. NPDC053427]|uniref:FAD-dependent oxidoreductase n=1 Tax=Streptomyces sp. NPDC053427 TaxID=3365701 RepID=UPI0037D014CD